MTTDNTPPPLGEIVGYRPDDDCSFFGYFTELPPPKEKQRIYSEDQLRAHAEQQMKKMQDEIEDMAAVLQMRGNALANAEQETKALRERLDKADGLLRWALDGYSANYDGAASMSEQIADFLKDKP